ncbi:MAG: sugar nucleotide-binding protein [Patescibacteria group bacterium]
MKTVAILGPTGMLGNGVFCQLRNKYKLILALRDQKKITLLENRYGPCENCKLIPFDSQALYSDYAQGFHDHHASPSLSKFINDIGDVNAVINCIGITNRYSNDHPLDAFFINSAFPHILSNVYGRKLIHITTDCVFSGKQGAPYDENAVPSPNDLYGLSKSLGEPSQRSLVLRTSIIGHEVSGFVSLIEWFKKQEGKTVQGYTTHLWNGITTIEFGNICDKIISNRDEYPSNGLFHIFSTDVTKYEMLQAFKKKYSVNVTIQPEEPDVVDRRLSTVFELCGKLKIPSFQKMLDAL